MSSPIGYDEYGNAIDMTSTDIAPIYSNTGSLTFDQHFCDAEECNEQEHYCQRYPCDTERLEKKLCKIEKGLGLVR